MARKSRKVTKQIGGINITPVKDSEFKYTIDPDRKIWNKNLFPIRIFILEAIQRIPWNKYTFEGNCIFMKNEWDAEKEENIIVPRELNVYADNSKGLPYNFFGGSVYEILNHIYSGADFPKLHDYVDPTGDLDILLTYPSHIRIPKEHPFEFIRYHFNEIVEENENGSLKKPISYNALTDDWTKWIMNEVEKIFKNKYYQRLFENTIPFDVKEDIETVNADLIIELGNLKLTRTYVNNSMIKIQLVAKYEEMTEPDHIFEFVITAAAVPDPVDTLDRYLIKKEYLSKPESPIFENVPIQRIIDLITGNREALVARQPLWDKITKHKVFNHVGRMQYLNQLLPKILVLKDNSFPITIPNPIRNYEGDEYNFGFFLSDFCIALLKIKKEGTLCHLDYRAKDGIGCDEREFYNSIVGNLLKMLEYKIKSLNRETMKFSYKGKVDYYTRGSEVIDGKEYNKNTLYKILTEDLEFKGGSRSKRNTRKLRKIGKKSRRI